MNSAETRDIPHHCICLWTWVASLARHVRTLADPECPWHLRKWVPWSPEVTR